MPVAVITQYQLQVQETIIAHNLFVTFQTISRFGNSEQNGYSSYTRPLLSHPNAKEKKVVWAWYVVGQGWGSNNTRKSSVVANSSVLLQTTQSTSSTDLPHTTVQYLIESQSMRQCHPLYYIIIYQSTLFFKNSYRLAYLKLQIATLLQLNYNHYCKWVGKPEHTTRVDCVLGQDYMDWKQESRCTWVSLISQVTSVSWLFCRGVWP